MFLISAFSVATLIIYYLVYKLFVCDSNGIKKYNSTLALVLAVLFSGAVRLVFAKLHPGYFSDMSCFTAWSSMVYEGGFKNFYLSPEFTDYPPGYMYVLYVIGFLKQFFGESIALIKLPAILFDLASGVLVYVLAKKRLEKPILISIFYLLCPAVILNSSLWGQVDSVYTLFLAGFILAVWYDKMILSYFIFALALFIKPQALIFSPVLICGMVENVFKKKSVKLIFKNFIFGLLAIALIVLLSVPFGLGEVIKQYMETLDSYKFATVNAFNLYGAFHLNWVDLTGALSIAGMSFVVLITALVLFLYFRGNKDYFFLAGVLAFATYMLCTKMHERYAYPAMLMFLISYIMTQNKRSIYLFFLTAFSQLVNTAWVLFLYSKNMNSYAGSYSVVVFSILNLLILAYMFYCCFAKQKQEENKFIIKQMRFFRSRKNVRMTKKDWVLLAIICVLYGVLSFYKLGAFEAPETYVDISKEETTVDFEEPTFINKIIVYPSCNDLNEDRAIYLKYIDENGNKKRTLIKEADVFCWNFIDFDEKVSKIIISSKSDRLFIMEMAFQGENGLVEVKSDSKLFDEQELVPDRKTFLNSTYFDEIYHARTGYEFLHGFKVYEWTHPPLGKTFISLGIKLFGMNTFGWRFVGNIFGILMLPLMYFFAKKMFKKTHIAFLTTLLFTVDFMHFTQTRISTVDVFVTFFIILMYVFMYDFYQMSFYDKPLKKTFKPLLLTGIAFGLGTACKWTAIYACGGIAIIFFGIMFARYFEYSSNGLKKEYNEKLIKTGFFCVLAFIIIPIIIYVASYYQFINTEGKNGIHSIIQNQTDIFVYHSRTVVNSEHPYASRWYTWPIMQRPIFYYSGSVSDTVKEGISAFGNPMVWWLGTIALLINIFFAIAQKDRKARFLIVGYLSCLLPWVPVARTTYIYHYFPCVPFLAMMIGHSFEKLYYKKAKLEKVLFISYVAVAIVLFAMFYPVLSGIAVDSSYVDNFLRWFSSWTLILD